MEFCRLNGLFKIEDYVTKELQMFYGENGKGIGYYYTDFPGKDKMMSIIPQHLQKHFSITLMKVNDEVPPHTDSGIKSTINFYLETGDCTTQFYKFSTNNPKTKQVDNQSDGFIYDENDLIKTGSFVAKPNEAWLLDVTIPHSVKPNKNFKQRVAVALSSTLCYDEVKSILIITGLL